MMRKNTELEITTQSGILNYLKMDENDNQNASIRKILRFYPRVDSCPFLSLHAVTQYSKTKNKPNGQLSYDTA
jgi:hypothetical protein